MRIDAFRFRHVGPFGADGVQLSGLSPGLNVVAEHNERGKSSLLAALETVLFLPHTSWKGDAKQLAREDGTPIGEVDFTHAGRAYRLRKRFVKSRHAELLDRESGATIAVKREAEERLGEMLGFDSGSQGPSGLLWVRQGDSMERASDDGQVASRLESELSTLVGGERARAYMDRTEGELGELLTRTGRVKTGGPLAAAEDALAATEAELETARAARDATRKMGEDLQRVRDRIAAVQSQGDPEEEARELAEARAALDAAKVARSEIDGKRERLARLQAEAERATAKLSEHLESVAAFDTAQARLAELSSLVETLETREAEARAKASEWVEALTELDGRRAARVQLERLRATQERLVERNAALQRVERTLDALDAELSRRSERVAERDAMPAITRDGLDRMDRLDRTIERLETQLASVDAALILELQPGATVRLGERTLKSGPVRLNAKQALSIEGIGDIRLDAPEAQDVQTQQDAARMELAELRDRLQVGSLEEATRIARARQEISDDIALIDRTVDSLAPDGRDALIDAQTRLADETERMAAMLSDAPDLEEVGDGVDLDAALATTRGELQAAQAAVNELALERARLETEKAALTRQLAAASDSARPDRRDAVSAELSAMSATLQTQIEAARSDLDTARAQAPADPALLEARIKRLSDMGRNRADTLADLRMEEAELNARRRESFEQRDPEAETTRLEERADRLREDVARHRRRANALVLLRDTLRDSQRALQDQYTEPVRRELLPLLRQVIDGADVALDESLGAQGLTRDGSDDALERLSGGTREQIAVLTRLAFARLLARGGQPCPVILDDALVYADDARRGRMFDVLNYVTSGDDPIQLLYLSCHEANALQLGGNRLRLERWPES